MAKKDEKIAQQQQIMDSMENGYDREIKSLQKENQKIKDLVKYMEESEQRLKSIKSQRDISFISVEKSNRSGSKVYGVDKNQRNRQNSKSFSINAFCGQVQSCDYDIWGTMPTKQVQQPPAPEINPFRRDENAELAKYRARCKDYEEIQLKMEY